MANFGQLTAEIGWRVWGTPANFNGFRVLASLFSRFDPQHSTKGATYIRLGGHHVGHRPAFFFFLAYSQRSQIWMSTILTHMAWP